MKFTIIVCTRNRPKMLTNCVRSIQSLLIPNNCNIHLVIVENNDEPECKSLIEKLMKLTPNIGYTYCLEKRIGLSTVRNTSLETAVKSNPDWICFLDDDQFVEQDWLNSYHSIIQTNSADVYSGKVEYILPENIKPEDLPIWFKFPLTQFQFPDLITFDTTGAGNTIAKASYFDGQPHEYRFDDKFRFTGGEDFDLFGRIHTNGGVIKYVTDALAYEVIAMERISIKWVINKEFSNGNLSGFGLFDQFGKWTEPKFRDQAIYLIRETVKRLFSGTLFLIWGLIIWPFSKRAIRYIVKGIRKIYWVVGLFLGFARIRYGLYKNTEGN